MKRYLMIIISGLMIFALAGCSSASSLFHESTSVEREKQTEAIDEAGLKVGFLFPSDTDAPDTVSHVDGVRTMQMETGLSDKQVIIKKSVTKDNCADEIDDLADKGCNIIFAGSSSYEKIVLEAAEKYPEVQFCQEDGKKAKKSGLSNFHNYYTKLYEAYYTAGVAAGMKLNDMLNRGTISSDSCVIGFVASEESAENISCATAFHLGVGQVCSQASTLIRYVGSRGVYDDDGKCARQLVEAGAALMCQHVYTTAVAAVCAENDIPIVGNEINIIDSAPREAITSAVSDWSVYYSYAVNCLLEGKKIDTDWCGGYEEGAVILSQLNDGILADGTVAKLTEVESDLRKGDTKVFDTEEFTIDGESLTELVKSNGDYKSYKKYVYDGEYHESEKRSAPSMTFLIDGIEESTYDYLGDLEKDDTTDSTADTEEE